MREDEMESVRWRKSTYSQPGGTCVELGQRDGEVLVRNSQRIDQGTVAFTRTELAAFILGCKAGELDDLT